MTQRFSNIGAKSLILKTLPVIFELNQMDYHMDILLESCSKNSDLQTEVYSKIDKDSIKNIESKIKIKFRCFIQPSY